jgi:hypothetical protein
MKYDLKCFLFFALCFAYKFKCVMALCDCLCQTLSGHLIPSCSMFQVSVLILLKSVTVIYS